jgi:hypothetical protein
MPIHPSKLVRQLEAEIAAANRDVSAARKLNLDRAVRIRKLASRRTDAFVDLARHYLPDLTHDSLAAAWHEVSNQIRDLLLLKNDKRRGLKEQLQQVQSQQQQLEQELEELRQQLDHAKLVLSCKMGNYRKMLREDPRIKACNQAISSIDHEIECYLSQLDAAQEEAKRKLPEYQESSLFRYLRERQYGTPAYDGRGLERHWDGWVAKLIDYQNASKSFHHLSTTPNLLQNLIDEKQARYRDLLGQLEAARDQAQTKFGVQKQTEIWQKICQQVEDQENLIEQARWEAATLKDQIYQLENINGDYYHQAVEIYREFLTQLDPQILKVYAACTESPIDDEICARLRSIQVEINAEQSLANDRQQEVVEQEQYLADLRDLSQRFHAHMRQSPAGLVVQGAVDLTHLLQQLRRRRLTPDDAWQMLRESMVQQVGRADEIDRTSQAADRKLPLDACFLAASDFAIAGPSGDQVDPAGVVLLPANQSDDPQSQYGFQTLAICSSQAEASQLISLLANSSIASFVHTQPLAPSGEDELAGPDEIHVMVESGMYHQAHQQLIAQRQHLRGAWNCPSCQTNIEGGHALCWRCGQRRQR